MKALITGITGFAGSHLAELLLSENIEVAGTVRNRSLQDNITDTVRKNAAFMECELKDSTSVKHVIASFKPDYIFHLAAQSFVPTSWTSPSDTIQNNIMGQLNLFEAVRELNLLETRIQIACSSEEYGLVFENELPILETNPLRPLSPYAVSKVAQDFMGYQYNQSYGMFIVRTRAFNHTGPRRGDMFMTSNFAKQAAMIEKGLSEPVIKVGNLEARRDLTDVRDTVRAYYVALQKAEPGEVYNICTGNAMSAGEVLNFLVSKTKKEVTVEQDPARMRPSDVPVLLGGNEKFVSRTGWKPTIALEQTLEDLLNYWRERV